LYPAIPTSIYGNKHPEDYDKVMETIKPETIVQKIVDILKPTT
ncbi:MAG TPA: ADP-heptose--LPS heptosyltransferase RfaF, partial [Maribacter sp.]|nr:ADP-heptose--LPS heptosyltransferase RfaF [Maribacter sp.]